MLLVIMKTLFKQYCYYFMPPKNLLWIYLETLVIFPSMINLFHAIYYSLPSLFQPSGPVHNSLIGRLLLFPPLWIFPGMQFDSLGDRSSILLKCLHKRVVYLNCGTCPICTRYVNAFWIWFTVLVEAIHKAICEFMYLVQNFDRRLVRWCIFGYKPIWLDFDVLRNVFGKVSQIYY